VGARAVAEQRQVLPVAHIGLRTTLLVAFGAAAAVPWITVRVERTLHDANRTIMVVGDSLSECLSSLHTRRTA
jgi:hypothetical protein